MKKAFLLEDDQERVKWFIEEFEKYNYEYDITDQVDVAIKMLAENKYKMVFLDHDLGGKQMVASEDPNTGFQVALTIPKTINKESTIIIHSRNPIGSKNIQNYLKESGCPNIGVAPFGMFNLNPY